MGLRNSSWGGFAEALAYGYLLEDYATQRAQRYARKMMANPDPVYGDGLRLMLPRVQSVGAARLAAELAAGHLPGPGGITPTRTAPPRRMRPV